MRHTTGRVFGAALLVTCLAPTVASADWRRLDSPNFVVIGDAGERDLRNVAVKFEGFRETLGRVLGAGVTATAVPTVVVVFPHDRAFTPYKPLYNGKPVRVGGVFYSGRDVNYITLLMDGGPDDYRVLFHEYAHLMIANVAMNLPAWLNEGLAEYYSTYEHAKDGREALIGRPLASHLGLLSERALLPLDELIAVDRRSPLYNEGERRSVFYAQSWALTHMLLLGEPSRLNELAAFIRAVQRGAPEGEAWRQAFEGAPIARDLQAYVRRMMFKAYRYKFTEGLTRVEAAAVPLSPPDVSAFLAGLRVRQQRLEDADALLAAALKADPAHPHAAIMRSHVAIARGDFGTAGERMTGLGPVDWFVAYTAGTAVTELIERGHDASPDRFTAARSYLDASSRVREIPNALAHLAMLDALSPAGATAGGRAAIERARALAPGRDDYALIHARLLAELGEFARAREILGPLMTPGFPDHVRDTARRWMGNVVRMEEHQLETVSRSSAPPPARATPPDSPPPPLTASRAQPIYRITQAGQQRLEGVLERIVCPGKGVTFHLRTVERLEMLHAPKLDVVDFVTYRDDLTGSVTCGPLKEPMRVYVTVREAASPDARVVVAIEFLAK